MSAWIAAALLLALGQPVPSSPPEDEEAQPPPPPVQAPAQVPAQAPAQAIVQGPGQTAQPGGPPAVPASDPDAIDAPAGNQPMDALTRRPVVRPFEMPALAQLGLGPLPYAPVAPPIDAPVSVERYVRSYEGPKNEVEQYYERGIRAHFDSEQALMGPLDGVWTVAGLNGQPLYLLVINEPGMGGGLEAAWRDLRRGPGPRAAGVVDFCNRDGQVLSVEFQQEDRVKRISLRLRRDADGRWRGELDDGARRDTVIMARTPTPS